MAAAALFGDKRTLVLTRRRGASSHDRRRPFSTPSCIVACIFAAAGMLVAVMQFGTYNGDISDQFGMSLSKMMAQRVLPSFNARTDSAPPIVVAYAISLIKCADHRSSTSGLLDAALVLRHSIHQTSVRNLASGSRYDYKMYVIVHENAVACLQPLRDAGYEVMIKPSPIKVSEIRGEYLRRSVHRERCCGADEFIKLYAYTMSEPLVVHVDIDFVMNRPMDVVFDALLGDKQAQQQVPLERPTDQPWPDTVHAVMTRDWPQVIPGRKAMYQAGFIVLKPDPTVFDEIVQVIREGNYTEGYGRDNGWHSGGYGAQVGSMAMQGLLAYYYDMKRPEMWMELNQCNFNHIGMDVRFRAPPGWNPGRRETGRCRNNADTCEDCMLTPLPDIFNIHLVTCHKPWSCIGEASEDLRQSKTHIATRQVNYEHCLELVKLWHSYRSDLESKLRQLTDDASLETGQNGDYMRNIFQGHCTGNTEYLPIGGSEATRKMISDLY